MAKEKESATPPEGPPPETPTVPSDAPPPEQVSLEEQQAKLDAQRKEQEKRQAELDAREEAMRPPPKPGRPGRLGGESKPASKKEKILWARLQKKAWVRIDPGAKPQLLEAGTEIHVLESAFSKRYMQDITAEVMVRDRRKRKKQEAIDRVQRELDEE